MFGHPMAFFTLTDYGDIWRPTPYQPNTRSPAKWLKRPKAGNLNPKPGQQRLILQALKVPTSCQMASSRQIPSITVYNHQIASASDQMPDLRACRSRSNAAYGPFCCWRKTQRHHSCGHKVPNRGATQKPLREWPWSVETFGSRPKGRRRGQMFDGSGSQRKTP